MTRAEILLALRKAGIEPREGDLGHFEAALPALEAALSALRAACPLGEDIQSPARR